ncbi:triose-phosphate transporter [Colletotrichum asianum]
MGADEKTRVSGEVPRGENGSILPTTNPDLEKSQPPKAAIHPALYVIVWISLSSSVILFNKWILDTLNFRKPDSSHKRSPPTRLIERRLPGYPDDLPLDLRDHYDPDPRALDYCSRRTQVG